MFAKMRGEQLDPEMGLFLSLQLWPVYCKTQNRQVRVASQFQHLTGHFSSSAEACALTGVHSALCQHFAYYKVLSTQ